MLQELRECKGHKIFLQGNVTAGYWEGVKIVKPQLRGCRGFT
jgi:hypothetical protein